MSATVAAEDHIFELLDDLRTAGSARERQAIINGATLAADAELLPTWKRQLMRIAPAIEWDELRSTANLAILEALHERSARGSEATEVANVGGWLFRVARNAVAASDACPAARGAVGSSTQLRKQRFAAHYEELLVRRLSRQPTRHEVAEAADAAWRARRVTGQASKAGHITTEDLRPALPTLGLHDADIADRHQLGVLEQLIEAEGGAASRKEALSLLRMLSEEEWNLLRELFTFNPESGEFEPVSHAEAGAKKGLHKASIWRRYNAVRWHLKAAREELHTHDLVGHSPVA